VLWSFTTYTAHRGFRRPPRALARRSWFFIPSADPDRVWVAFRDPNQPAGEVALRAVREMTAGGRVTVPDFRPPAGRWPMAALASGLLFTDRANDAFKIWGPREADRRRTRPGGPDRRARTGTG
jgi:hypothetical protein